MKKYILIAVLLAGTSLLLIPACKYNVAEPEYSNSEFVEPQVKPKINSITPASITPGVNTITITGENLNSVSDNRIFLEIPGQTVISPDIIEKTATSIIFRRPNLGTDSCFIKLVPDSGLVVKYGPFKVERVIEQFGSFVDYAVQLAGLDVDNAGNIYVAKGGTAPFAIYKVTPEGNRTNLADSLSKPDISSPPSGAPTGVALSPDGYLILFRGHRHIQRVNTLTGEVSSWHQLRTNRQLRVGAFDSNGYLYAGGIRTSLWVIAPDSTSQELASMYPTAAGDSIMAMKVYQNYLYIAIASASGRIVVRHSIGAGGNLGSSEVVVNLSQFTSQMIRDFAIASDGTIFITTDGDNSFIKYDPLAGSFEYFYKGIVRPYAKQLSWSNENYLYMIGGNTNATVTAESQDWTVYRIDVGISGMK